MIYYRTGKGSKRHASYYCANGRRAIRTGDPLAIPADQVKDWAPCRFCCDAAELADSPAPKIEKPAEALCRNSGVTNPRRMYSTCRDCGKEGTVNRSTGSLRAHKPMPQP